MKLVKLKKRKHGKFYMFYFDIGIVRPCRHVEFVQYDKNRGYIGATWYELNKHETLMHIADQV